MSPSAGHGLGWRGEGRSHHQLMQSALRKVFCWVREGVRGPEKGRVRIRGLESGAQSVVPTPPPSACPVPPPRSLRK